MSASFLASMTKLAVRASVFLCTSSMAKQISLDQLINGYLAFNVEAKLLKSELNLIEANAIAQQSDFDPKVTSSLEYQQSRTNDLSNGKLTSSLSKKFPSATEARLSASYHRISNNSEQLERISTVSAKLTQTLWGPESQGHINSKSKITQHESQVIRSKVKTNLETQIVQLIDHYYQAAGLKIMIESLEDRLQREQRRIRIVKRQVNSGFMERSYLIQLETALIASKNHLRENIFALEEILSQLEEQVGSKFFQSKSYPIKQLKFQNANSQHIDNLCQKKQANSESFHEQELGHKAQFLMASIKKLSHEQRVKVFASIGTQFNQSERANSLQTNNSFNISRIGPDYNFAILGVNLTLSDHKAKSQQIKLNQELLQNKLKLKLFQDNKKSTLKKLCLKLQLYETTKRSLEEKMNLEERRIKILDRDFSIGKKDLNALILAEDALSSTSKQISQIEVNKQQVYWNIKRLNGELQKYVNYSLN